MFKNRTIAEENTSKKENQSQISLQKLIKLDCRDSNFLFKDQLRNYYFKVHYPHTSTDVCPGEHLLKKFWNHVQANYFKKLQAQDTYRLDYVKTVFAEQMQNQTSHQSEGQFQSLLRTVLNDNLAEALISSDLKHQDEQNLYDRLHISWKKFQLRLTNRQNKAINQELNNSLKALQPKKYKKKYENSLKREGEILKELLASNLFNGEKQESDNQIQNQIQQLENQLSQIQKVNSTTVKFLEENIIASSQEGTSENKVNQHKKTKRRSKTSKQKMESGKSSLFTQPLQLSLKQIEFTIKNLQKRQLSESLSKILQCKKINGEYFFLVSMQAAMHVEPKLFSQKQLLELNQIRQTSLFQFYRTGVKSLYSYTCQSYIGFSQLSKNRQGLGKYKPTDVFEMMKKNPTCSNEHYEIFNKFSTCHHCKFLYPEYLLKSCKFASDRQVMPKSNYEATLDPDFSEVNLAAGIQDKARVSQRFTTRKKNCLTGYAKINQEYVCGRKFCFSCLKDNYPNDIMNESIFCPFCQGNCSCSRCLRNQKIVKLRSAYSILGGQFTALSVESCLEQLQSKEESSTPKRRGRPKKQMKKSHITVNKVQKKMRPILGELNLGGVSGMGQRRITLSNKKEYASFSIIKQDEQKKVDAETEVFAFIASQAKKRKTSKKQVLMHQKIRETLKKLGRYETN